MIRMIGSFIVIGCGWIFGHIAVKRQREKLRQRVLLSSYLDHMKAELEFNQSSFESIASGLSQRTMFRDFHFAYFCGQRSFGYPFFLRFYDGVQENKLLFGSEICECLESLSGRLGNYSSEDQAAAIELCLQRISQINQELRTKVEQNAKLYHSLGLLGGTAVVIFLW